MKQRILIITILLFLSLYNTQKTINAIGGNFAAVNSKNTPKVAEYSFLTKSYSNNGFHFQDITSVNTLHGDSTGFFVEPVTSPFGISYFDKNEKTR
jgi:hypothetical protein